MSAKASQITGVSIVYSIVYPATDQRKHQSSASLSFVVTGGRWIPRTSEFPSQRASSAENASFPFDDVITWSVFPFMIAVIIIYHIVFYWIMSYRDATVQVLIDKRVLHKERVHLRGISHGTLLLYYHWGWYIWCCNVVQSSHPKCDSFNEILLCGASSHTAICYTMLSDLVKARCRWIFINSLSLGDVAVILELYFSNLLHRIVA